MLSLVRGGPKFLVFESGDIEVLKLYLKERFDSDEYDLSTAIEKSGEEYTIIFITDIIKDIVKTEDAQGIMLIREEPDIVLCALMNDGKNELISKARIAPRILIVRAMGDMNKVVEEINSDYNGEIGSFVDILNNNNEKGTIIALTDRPLHRKMCIKDLYNKSLFVQQKYHTLYRELRMHALKYLNTGIGNRDWYEIEIRIYDRYSEYKLHYERLLKIIEALDLGIILGESWGKDYPRLFMEVGVYRIRFFTFYEPKYIKKILVGLEHIDDGTRIVDYDVYYHRKKIDWAEAAEGDIRTRHLLSKKYRDEILSKLGSYEKSHIAELEEKILKTRT